MLYVISCQTRGGTLLSKYGYYSKKAGLFHIYYIYGCTQSKEFQLEIRIVFKGILHAVAQDIQNGNTRITTGELPQLFDLYCEI